MNYKKLHRGNFPDPEFYSHVGTYGDWKAYAARKVTDDIVRVKLVSMVPTKGANLFLKYTLNLRRFVLCKDRKYFGNAYPFELIALEVDMEKYVRNLEDKEKPF